MLRCFIGMEPQPETRAALSAVQAEMLAIEALGATIKPSKRENLHLTLKFLGDVPDAQQDSLRAALHRIAAMHAPVHAGVRGLSAFPMPHQPRSVYAAIGGGTEAVLRLMAAISEGCAPLGFEQDHKPRVPHVTLARLSRVDPRGRLYQWLGQAPVRDYGLVEGSTFSLYASTLTPQGSIYEPLAAFALRGDV